MEEDTPKFCETKETNINQQSAFSFSFVEKKETKIHYHSQHNSSHKSKKKHKKSKSLHKSKFIKLEEHNQDRKKYIEEFLVKHKFKLSNKFDQKHCEKFLISKEEAFEKPFFQLEEMNKQPILC